MERKQYALKEMTLDEAGSFRAVFATLGVVDHHGDIIMPGSIEQGAKVRVSAYNHASWGGALPVGKGDIAEVGNELVATGKFFLDTSNGAETYKTIKNLGDLGEWSFGFDIIEKDYQQDEATGREYRRLKKLKVYEVSPVLLGAGVGTRTTDIKALEAKAAIPSHSTATSKDSWDGSRAEKHLKLDQDYAYYRKAFAWMNEDADPSKKSSCKFIHHEVAADGSIGAANVKACQTGIGILNGGRGGTKIPPADRKGVYDHLARHIKDAGLEPPELKSYDEGTSITYADHAGWVYGDVIDFVQRSRGIALVNAEKGKPAVSEQNREMLTGIACELKAAGEALEELLGECEAKSEELDTELAALFSAVETNELMRSVR